MNSVIGYGITMAAGLFLSAVLYVLRARRKGLPLSRILAGIPAGILLAYLCAKLVFLAFFHVSVEDRGLGMLVRLVPGEFSFVSGCAGFCLGIENELSLLLQREDGFTHQVESTEGVLEPCVAGAGIDDGGQS